jgi:short-subunit dehydrogenase
MKAVITGATSGIGEEFARQLAAEGYDLLLVARREHLLNNLKNEIESQHGVAVETVVCDLADPQQVRNLEERIERIDDLEFMINNAGFGREGTYPDVDPDHEVEMIQVHVIALVRLARAALVPMCQRKKGFLVNLASVVSFLYGTNCAQYIATKAYVLSFSKSISYDVAAHGVRIQALCPGLTHTGFHDTATMKSSVKEIAPSIAWLSTPFVVRRSLRSLKSRWHRVVCIPSWRYKFVLLLLCNPLGEWFTKMMYAYRAREK